MNAFKTVIFFLIYQVASYGQNYEARTSSDLPKLVQKLTKNSTTELEKAESLFRWVTTNIRYDYKLFNKRHKRKGFECEEDEETCTKKYIKYQTSALNKTLRQKKAVCEGYSTLYQRMCELAGIECYSIGGYIKTQKNQIGRMGQLDHAWNVFIIDEEYFYCDPTWAAGYCTLGSDGKLDGFVPLYDEYYWSTPIDRLSRTHFPAEKVLLAKSVADKKRYKENPYIEISKLPMTDLINPKSGIIFGCKGDTIRFDFSYKEEIEHLQINTNITRNPRIYKPVDGVETIDDRALEKQKYITPERKDDLYSFYYVLESDRVRYIEILFDYEIAIKYLVKN